MIVAIAVGRSGLNALLVASQVVLSIVLPFVVFPLIYLTSSKTIMKVRKPRASPPDTPLETPTMPTLPMTAAAIAELDSRGQIDDVLETSIHTAAPNVESEKSPHVDVQEEKREEPEVVLNVLEADEETAPSEEPEAEFIDYSNAWCVTVIAYAIFIVVLAANLYVIVTLAREDS